MLPEAHIGHRAPERLRIKIPSKKGKPSYFSGLSDVFSRDKRFVKLEVNDLTGSVLFLGKDIDIDAIAEYGEANQLFKLDRVHPYPVPVSRKVVSPVGKLSNYFHTLTGGEVDLQGMAFLTLMGVGLYQIIRGNFRAPPWYTAFWYALGMFTKSLSDKDDKGPKA
jgi:hypothetical protein